MTFVLVIKFLSLGKKKKTVQNEPNNMFATFNSNSVTIASICFQMHIQFYLAPYSMSIGFLSEMEMFLREEYRFIESSLAFHRTLVIMSMSIKESSRSLVA